MIETHIDILLLKEDLKSVHEIIRKYNFDFPVFIIDNEETVRIEFVSDYEEYEFITELGESFEGYEFKKAPELGENIIKLKIHRYYSSFSTDGWGRPIEDPLNETLFLVKKSIDDNGSPKINPKIIVSYKNEISTYFVNIVLAQKKEEKGFLVMKDFENNHYGKPHKFEHFDRFSLRLLDSYSYGLSNLKDYVRQKIKMNKKKRKRNPNS